MMGVSFGRETRVVKEGMLELGFMQCVNGAGAVCCSMTVRWPWTSEIVVNATLT
jgi:hypothetical protein